MYGSSPARTANGGALLVNAWVVADGDQPEFVELLDGLFEYLRTLEGFIEGAVLQSANPTRFVSYVRVRSAQDRQRLFQDGNVSARLRAVGEIAHADLHSYDVLHAYGPDGV